MFIVHCMASNNVSEIECKNNLNVRVSIYSMWFMQEHNRFYQRDLLKMRAFHATSLHCDCDISYYNKQIDFNKK